MLCFFVFSISTAPAALIDLENGVTKDDKDTLTPFDDQYWIQDLNRFVGMTYDEQIAAIGNLDSQGLSNISEWHMATYADILTLWDNYGLEEITNAFVPTVVQTGWTSWQGRYNRAGGLSTHYLVIMHHNLDEVSGGIKIQTKDSETEFGAFVTAYARPYEFYELTITKAKVKFEDGPNNDNFKINGEQKTRKSVTVMYLFGTF